MAELTEEEVKNGKKILEGIVILLWVVAVITAIGFLTFNANQAIEGFNWFPFHWGTVHIGFPGK